MSDDQRDQDQNEGFQNIGTLFDDYEVKEGEGYITKEFQDYGYRLAVKLNDMKHKGLYIKMAKEEERSVLERALRFVIDSQARSKAKLFMWKVKQIKKQDKEED